MTEFERTTCSTLHNILMGPGVVWRLGEIWVTRELATILAARRRRPRPGAILALVEVACISNARKRSYSPTPRLLRDLKWGSAVTVKRCRGVRSMGRHAGDVQTVKGLDVGCSWLGYQNRWVAPDVERVVLWVGIGQCVIARLRARHKNVGIDVSVMGKAIRRPIHRPSAERGKHAG